MNDRTAIHNDHYDRYDPRYCGKMEGFKKKNRGDGQPSTVNATATPTEGEKFAYILNLVTKLTWMRRLIFAARANRLLCSLLKITA